MRGYAERVGRAGSKHASYDVFSCGSRDKLQFAISAGLPTVGISSLARRRPERDAKDIAPTPERGWLAIDAASRGVRRPTYHGVRCIERTVPKLVRLMTPASNANNECQEQRSSHGRCAKSPNM